jgi:hypothetical protein
MKHCRRFFNLTNGNSSKNLFYYQKGKKYETIHIIDEAPLLNSNSHFSASSEVLTVPKQIHSSLHSANLEYKIESDNCASKLCFWSIYYCSSAMTDSMQSTTSGWPSIVLILAATVPFILFWNPIRRLINEYRLYRRCQQYPHIVVCKENSPTTTWERNIGDVISGGIILLSRCLYSMLLSVFGLMRDILLAVLTSTKSTEKSTTTTAETPVTELAISKEIEEERTMNLSHIEKQVKSVLHRPLHLATRNDELNLEEKAQMALTVKHNFMVQRQSEEIFESSSFQNTDTVDLSMQQGHYSMASAPPLPQRRSDVNRRIINTTHSRPSKRRLPIQIVATMSTAVTLTQSVDIDSSSLSEKMRKRRFNGGSSMGTDVVSEQGDGDVSRKRRKLNTGRMPLQGCYARRPTVGAWQTTKILDKREREGREERLLRSMSRKRTKPTVEHPKSFTPAPTSTAGPVSSTPAFNFGQAATNTSTSLTVSEEKHETPASVATPAPTFLFGANGNATSNTSKIKAATGVAETKSEPAAKAPTAFSFGSTPTMTTNTAATSNETQKAQPAEQVPPKFGITPSTTTNSTGAASLPSAQLSIAFASSTPAAPAPSFGATPAAPTQAPTASGSVAAPVLSFGGVTATSAAPTFAAAQAPSGFGTQPLAAQAFGATTQPPTTFGAPPAPATGNSFGSTLGTQFGGSSGQHTSAPTSSHPSGSQGFNHNSFVSQPAMPANTQQMSFGNTKENTNPGGFNSTYQASLPSNGLLKPQPANGNAAPPLGMNGGFPMGSSNGAASAMFGGSNAGGISGFSAGAPPAAVTTGASARRMARKSRNRRR